MTQQPPADDDAAMLSAEARAIGTLDRPADRLDCLIEQLDGREARLNAAADRALAPNTVTTDKESRPDAE